MAVLTINSVNVAVESVQENEPFEVGETSRSFNGSMRTSVRVLKRKWQATTIALDTTAMATLKTALGVHGIYNCTGDMFQGSTVSCLVKYTSSKIVASADVIAGYSFLWQLVISMEEA
jgi:delta-aminolevulinic acid dehydratase/porphobilinogen synthase